jgi:hypothetical protein
MLCASGFEFQEKLRLAMMEQEAAKRSLSHAAPVPSHHSVKRLEDASRRYDKRLSDFQNHKQVCALCKES